VTPTLLFYKSGSSESFLQTAISRGSLLQQAFREITQVGSLPSQGVSKLKLHIKNLWFPAGSLSDVFNLKLGVELRSAVSTEGVNVFQRWREKHAPEHFKRFSMYPPRVGIIQRINRKIINHEQIEIALRDRGFDVHTLNFNSSTPIKEQLTKVANLTSLVGYHGAGLSLGRVLAPSAAILEVQGFPCTVKQRSRMDFTSRFAMIPSIPNSLRDDTSKQTLEKFCLEKTNIPGMSNDVRKHDAIVDIHLLIQKICELDPVFSDGNHVPHDACAVQLPRSR